MNPTPRVGASAERTGLMAQAFLRRGPTMNRLIRPSYPSEPKMSLLTRLRRIVATDPSPPRSYFGVPRANASAFR